MRLYLRRIFSTLGFQAHLMAMALLCHSTTYVLDEYLRTPADHPLHLELQQEASLQWYRSWPPILI